MIPNEKTAISIYWGARLLAAKNEKGCEETYYYAIEDLELPTWE